MTHLNVTALTVVVGVLIPFLTGLVAKEKNGAVRTVVNGLLSAAAGAVTLAIAEGGNVSLASWFLGIASTWGASVLAYQGLWGPTGLLDHAVEWVAAKLAKVGIHLPQAEIVTVEEAIKALFGDAVQWLSAEELRHHVSPEPSTKVVNVLVPEGSVAHVVGDVALVHPATECCGSGEACSSATCTGIASEEEADEPAVIPPLQGPGHNFTKEGV